MGQALKTIRHGVRGVAMATWPLSTPLIGRRFLWSDRGGSGGSRGGRPPIELRSWTWLLIMTPVSLCSLSRQPRVPRKYIYNLQQLAAPTPSLLLVACKVGSSWFYKYIREDHRRHQQVVICQLLTPELSL